MNKYLKYRPTVKLERLSPIFCDICQFVTHEKELLKCHEKMSHPETDFSQSFETSVLNVEVTKTGNAKCLFLLFLSTRKGYRT
jgi:hypothetical protein